jgi:hypothetical protein
MSETILSETIFCLKEQNRCLKVMASPARSLSVMSWTDINFWSLPGLPVQVFMWSKDYVGGSHVRHAISIYFNCAPAISIAILIAILIISIYFDQFDLFWSISIHFDPFRSISIQPSKSPKHFDHASAISDLFRYKIEIAKIKPVWHPARYPHGHMCASHSWFLHLPGQSRVLSLNTLTESDKADGISISDCLLVTNCDSGWKNVIK